MLALVKAIFSCPPPRNYTLKFDHVLSPPTMKWDLRPWCDLLLVLSDVCFVSGLVGVLRKITPRCIPLVLLERKSYRARRRKGVYTEERCLHRGIQWNIILIQLLLTDRQNTNLQLWGRIVQGWVVSQTWWLSEGLQSEGEKKENGFEFLSHLFLWAQLSWR